MPNDALLGRMRLVGASYVSCSLVAFLTLLAGLLVLEPYPVLGVLLTLGGMALALYGTAGLCGARLGGKKQESSSAVRISPASERDGNNEV